MFAGLSKEEVQQRIQEGKINTIEIKITRTYKEIFKSNIFTFFNLMNVVLFILILFVKSYRNGLFFLTIIANTCVGIFQEIRSKKVLDKLAIVTMNKIEVYRDKDKIILPIDQLVLDDVVVIRAGMQVPSDAVILEGKLEVNESLLTGESVPQLKERDNELFSGSVVTSGEAVCKIIHVGKDNYSSKIIQEAKKYKGITSDLKKSIDTILKIISFIIIPLGILLFTNQYFMLHFSLKEAVVKTVAALIGMIPEGLVFLTSVALAISVMRLAQKKTLVQDLYCVETLARVDTLCLDKTGTLTEGKMKVIESFKMQEIDLDEIMGNYCTVFPDGNATSLALSASFKLLQNYSIKDKLDFSSDRKYSAITFTDKGTYCLGAAQFLFPNHKDVIELAQKYAVDGYRVIFLGKSEKGIIDNKIVDAIPLAYMLIRDQIRPTAKATIEYFYKQDVTCKIISGDDPLTVSNIAKSVGVRNTDEYVDASQYSDEELSKLILEKTIFGRVTPYQKKLFVEALQNAGHVVAMTGDGVNDVPALKKANASIAMASGSDAAKNASNIVLLDSDFSSLPSVVNEGRRVINNIRSASSMFLIKTAFSVVLSILTVLLSQAYPFQPIQLTIIGIFSIGIPTFLLQFEPNFQRVDGKFLRVAFRNAIPSAMAIVFGILLGMILNAYFRFPASMVSTFNAIQTGIIYTFTLYMVYSPLSKYRLFVILTMQTLLALSFLFGANFLGLTTLSLPLIIAIVVYSLFSIVLVKGFKAIFQWLIKSLGY
ncbi:HAD-IC family P-type ATPase [Anaerorhabdus furcosa]|uniref:Cation-transporting ATPase E n=1 Tax=Anaerorhabdus furcosa TaxID=118967 RepID=A0A1T4NVG7_9FIRM|nr:HAD-IC family P-type ATPase [Anaerorhabdus furcosa]SJZ83350.1 cation-transporting ATPase E [Anaerorhabdus furcosa]